MQVDRSTLIAAIEAGIEADRRQDGIGSTWNDNRQLTEDEIGALREYAKTAEYVMFRRFASCPLTQVGSIPTRQDNWPDIPWCFVHGYDDHMEKRTGQYQGEGEVIG